MVLPLLFGITAVGGGLAWVLDKGGLLDADSGKTSVKQSVKVQK